MLSLEEHICICKKCELKSTKTAIPARGKNTKFTLLNGNKKVVDKYIVDDCLLKLRTQDEKCDYLFNIRTEKIAYFIECKGSDILKAVDQINSTIDILKENFFGYILKGRIISTRVYSPDLRTVSYRKLREKLNGHLVTKNISLEDSI